VAPASVAGKLSSEISAFAHDFRTPSVQQASVGLEKEVARRLAIGANYMYVHGQHLIRARDVNLPEPVAVKYPVYDEDGTALLGYYTVDSFARWETKSSVSCPYPPCVGEVARPIPQLGAINVFESAASSVYHGLTLSAQRRVSRGLYFRAGYTFARAIDDAQDALVAGRPSTVQNSYSLKDERGLSTTDQRHRFVGFASTFRRRLRQEDGTELVGDQQVRIQFGGDVEQRRQQFVLHGARVMLAPKILHHARPVKIGEQAVVAQAQALQDLRRRDPQHLLEALPA
jgi:hypothetical protein